ncbi:MAG TPA: hypothetical protein VEJ86_02185, partial [Candidatus Binataceae bacterium]|nr:hypothetical protein [Candidatus Binataceae bacterium]
AGVGAVLARHRLQCLPEAHCYLRYLGRRIDITRAADEAPREEISFLHEETISPEQIGSYKLALHQGFARQWLARAKPRDGLTFDQLWRIREECIEALGQ